MSAATQATPNPDVNVAGMKPGDAAVEVKPHQGGGLTLSPLPVGGRRGRKTAKKTKKAGRRRGGADDEVAAAPAVGARRRKTAKKSKKAGRR